jgi:hypothetical protein
MSKLRFLSPGHMSSGCAGLATVCNATGRKTRERVGSCRVRLQRRSDQAITTSLGQQPDGDETPGVAVAPVALAGAIMPGFARLIVTASLHAAELGVGTTVRVGSMLVLPNSVIAG